MSDMSSSKHETKVKESPFGYIAEFFDVVKKRSKDIKLGGWVSNYPRQGQCVICKRMKNIIACVDETHNLLCKGCAEKRPHCYGCLACEIAEKHKFTNKEIFQIIFDYWLSVDSLPCREIETRLDDDIMKIEEKGEDDVIARDIATICELINEYTQQHPNEKRGSIEIESENEDEEETSIPHVPAKPSKESENDASGSEDKKDQKKRKNEDESESEDSDSEVELEKSLKRQFREERKLRGEDSDSEGDEELAKQTMEEIPTNFLEEEGKDDVEQIRDIVGMLRGHGKKIKRAII